MLKDVHINFHNTPKLSKKAINGLIKDLQIHLSFTIKSIEINFLNEDAMVKLNKTYLNHNFPTDIITFDYSLGTKNIDGELFISYKEAELNAEKYRVTQQEEFTRLIIHGILHLNGYDDKKSSDKSVMKRLENELVRKFKHHLQK